MKHIAWIIVLLFPFTLFAQKAERKNLREGNKLYNDEKYTEAEISYRRSLEVNPTSEQGIFNLGNALGATLGALPLKAGLGYQYPALIGVPFAFLGCILLIVFSRKYETKSYKRSKTLSSDKAK